MDIIAQVLFLHEHEDEKPECFQFRTFKKFIYNIIKIDNFVYCHALLAMSSNIPLRLLPPSLPAFLILEKEPLMGLSPVISISSISG
jgi:hypothetical protein